jgi:inositol-phosphate phosphatase/L-galactose 1-phosphate phosphatase/histidinol-phosphatase
MPPTDPVALLAFAEQLADLARPLAQRWFRGAPSLEQKHDRTPVTAADRAIERTLRERIAAVFPDHGVLGEEEGALRTDAEFVWVLDPIDGTKAFATGNPLFGTLVGLLHHGVPRLGVLDAPALGERWRGSHGHGAFHGERRLRTRARRRLAEAVLYCTTPDPMAAHEGFQRLRRQVQWTSYGGDCIAYGLLAMGHVDLVVDRGLQPYDWAALVPIVEQAGGVLCDWRGDALTLPSDGAVVAASCRELADEALAVLAGTA